MFFICTECADLLPSFCQASNKAGYVFYFHEEAASGDAAFFVSVAIRGSSTEKKSPAGNNRRGSLLSVFDLYGFAVSATRNPISFSLSAESNFCEQVAARQCIAQKFQPPPRK